MYRRYPLIGHQLQGREKKLVLFGLQSVESSSTRDELSEVTLGHNILRCVLQEQSLDWLRWVLDLLGSLLAPSRQKTLSHLGSCSYI